MKPPWPLKGDTGKARFRASVQAWDYSIVSWTCVPFRLTGRVFRQLIVRLADWLGLC